MAIADISYGPGLPNDSELRLLHDVDRKRLIVFGARSADAALEFARCGAFVLTIVPDDETVTASRERAASEELRAEFRAGDYADLAFLRADSQDLAFSVWSFSEVADLDRVFRQVHRVLRPNAAFVFSCHHPLAGCVHRDPAPDGKLFTSAEIRRDYGDQQAVGVTSDGVEATIYPRSVSDLYSALRRAGFAVEQFVEASTDRREHGRPDYPTALVWKAHKEGN